MTENTEFQSEPGPAAWNKQGNTFLLQGNTQAAMECYQKALSLDPAYFGACYNLGHVFLQKKDLKTATRYFQQTLSLKPDFHEAHNGMGNIFFQQEKLNEAVESYQRALTLKPDFYEARNNLGSVFLQQGALDAAEKCFQENLSARSVLNANHICNILRMLGDTLKEQGRFDEAGACYQEAVSLQPDAKDAARVRLHESMLLLLKGDLKAGWHAYEHRYELPEFHYLQKIPPRWDGAPLPDKTLLVRSEQGLGDTLHFIRYLPLARERCGRLIFLCQKQLKLLLAQFPGIDQLITSLNPGSNDISYDAAVGIMSLPNIFGASLENVPSAPYLQASPESIHFWKQHIMPDKLNIGLVWSGNPSYRLDWKRSIPLSAFAPLARIPNMVFHSMQVGSPASAAKNPPSGMSLMDWSAQLRDFSDTAGLIANLDIIISVDTAVAHLAGAMGKPVWTLLPFVPDWRWFLNQEDTPWYPTMRLFRQPGIGKWEPVMENIVTELSVQAKVKTETPSPPSHSSLLTSPTSHFYLLNLKPCRHGLMLYIRKDMYVGRSLELYSEFSEAEADLFRQFIRPGDVIIEAGANIGTHTVFLAKLTGHQGKIIAYEPQRFVFQILCANLALNELTNVYARHAAVGREPGFIKVPFLNYAENNNFGGLSLGEYQTGETVPVETIDQTIKQTIDTLNPGSIRLIKADVEGMEAEVLAGATETIRQFRPVLYVENDRKEKSAALIQLIHSLGYRMWQHFPPLFNPNNFAGNHENVFGNIVSANLLCLPLEADVNISGLREVVMGQTR